MLSCDDSDEMHINPVLMAPFLLLLVSVVALVISGTSSVSYYYDIMIDDPDVS